MGETGCFVAQCYSYCTGIITCIECHVEPGVKGLVSYGLRSVPAFYSQLVQGAREPVLAQLKLAWWRDRLAQPVAERSGGEPILSALAAWPGDPAPLLALADGWEAMLDDDRPDHAIAGLAAARGRLGAGLARAAGEADHAAAAEQALHDWTLAEIGRTGDGQAVPISSRLILPRSLRALAVLHGLARRGYGRAGRAPGLRALAAAVRIGMVGR